MGVGGAGGRLVELRERKRRAQFEAARALLLCDGDGGQERFFRGRGIGGVVLQQDFAARAMQFRLRMCDGPGDRPSPALRRGWRRRGSGSPASASVFARAIFTSPSKIRMFCARKLSTPAAHAVEPAEQVALDPRPSIEKHSEGAELGRSCALAIRASSKELAFPLTGPPCINANWAANMCPRPIVLPCVRDAMRASIRDMNDAARSTSPRGHKTSARYAIAETPGSCPKRNARSSSRPGWNMASARSK